MDRCRHRTSCTPNCPMYVTNDKFKKLHGVSCVLEAMWNEIDEKADENSLSSMKEELYYEYANKSDVEHKLDDHEQRISNLE